MEKCAVRRTGALRQVMIGRSPRILGAVLVVVAGLGVAQLRAQDAPNGTDDADSRAGIRRHA
jgi:hypothetical protein